MLLICASVMLLKSVTFGMCCLISLFVFSMDPFCHEEYESVKYTGTPLRCLLIHWCSANSLPLSVVMVCSFLLYTARRIGRKPRTKVWLHAQKLDTRLKVRGKVARQTEAR